MNKKQTTAAKHQELFSLTYYLTKKNDKKNEKKNFRANKKLNKDKKEDDNLLVQEELHTEEHVHSANCNHEE